MSTPVRVLVTGAASQTGYLLGRDIAGGYMLGPTQKVALHLFDLRVMASGLRSIAKELVDFLYELLEEVIVTDKVEVAFDQIDIAIMLAAKPRKEGMERKDLLAENVKIFKDQGAALDKYAKKSVKVVVEGDPANTYALVMSKFAPSIPAKNFSALTRLDHNRAETQIANRFAILHSKVKNCIIWGNHSATQFPDVSHAVVELPSGKKSVFEAVNNEAWIKTEFMKRIQSRDVALTAASPFTSAVSVSNAIVGHMRDWWLGTKEGEWVSMAVMSDGSYDSPAGVIFSFPVTIKNKEWTIVRGLSMDDWAKSKIKITADELLEEMKVALES